jgi:hypothetical protein
LHDAAKGFLRISHLSKLEFSLYHCFSVQGETLGTLIEGHGQLAQHPKVGPHLITVIDRHGHHASAGDDRITLAQVQTMV